MKKVFIYLIIGCLFSACLEKIDFPVNEDPVQQLVVNGGLNADTTIHLIRLSLTGKVEGNNPVQPVEGAEIWVEEGESNYYFVESETKPGNYYSNNFAVDVLKTYMLNIEWNGQHYEASASGVESQSFNPIEYYQFEGGPNIGEDPPGFYSISLPGNFGGGVPYLYSLEYDIPKNWKDDFPYPIPLYAEDIGQSGPYDTTYLIHPGIETAALFEYGESAIGGLPIGTKFTERRYYLTEDYYQFLRAILMETDWRGTNILQTIPANVPTNITNGAFGYFYVFESQEVISYVLEEE